MKTTIYHSIIYKLVLIHTLDFIFHCSSFSHYSYPVLKPPQIFCVSLNKPNFLHSIPLHLLLHLFKMSSSLLFNIHALCEMPNISRSHLTVTFTVNNNILICHTFIWDKHTPHPIQTKIYTYIYAFMPRKEESYHITACYKYLHSHCLHFFLVFNKKIIMVLTPVQSQYPVTNWLIK